MKITIAIVARLGEHNTRDTDLSARATIAERRSEVHRRAQHKLRFRTVAALSDYARYAMHADKRVARAICSGVLAATPRSYVNLTAARYPPIKRDANRNARLPYYIDYVPFALRGSRRFCITDAADDRDVAAMSIFPLWNLERRVRDRERGKARKEQLLFNDFGSRWVLLTASSHDSAAKGLPSTKRNSDPPRS